MKFGGTSVASPEKLIDIVRKAVERDRTILVCSAISKCTDTLIRLGKLASERDEKYLAELAALQDRHHAMIASIIPADRQKAVQETVDGLFDSLKGILHGVFLLGELSPTSLDAVQRSFRASLHRTSRDARPPWVAAVQTTPPRCWRRASKPVWWRSGPTCRAS